MARRPRIVDGGMRQLVAPKTIRRWLAGGLVATFTLCCPFLPAVAASEDRGECHAPAENQDHSQPPAQACLLDRVELPDSGTVLHALEAAGAANASVASMLSADHRAQTHRQTHWIVSERLSNLPVYLRTSALLI